MVKRISRKRSKKYNKRNKTKRKMNHMNTMRNYTKRKNTRYKNTKYKNTKLRNNKRRNMRGGSYEDQIRRAIELSLMDMERAGGSGPIETRGQIINRTKLEAAQVRLAFAKLLIGESELIDNIDIIIKIGDLLTDNLLVVLPDNHPRRKWEEWKALYAPGEVQEPEFNVDQATFTLDNLNIGDRYSVGLGDYFGAPVNYRGEFEITDFNYRSHEESFICGVILSDRPNMIEFEYIVPGSYYGKTMGRKEGGWTTRWRSPCGGTVINCSRIEPS
jgi:hypothetical protein